MSLGSITTFSAPSVFAYRPGDMRPSTQPFRPGTPPGAGQPRPEPEKVSEQLERWLSADGDKTLGSLVELFGEKSFAILFVLLLGVPALPLPTGGATHVTTSGCLSAGACSSSQEAGKNASSSRS
jgi:hypothetical protein